jgi:hypothetical protein
MFVRALTVISFLAAVAAFSTPGYADSTTKIKSAEAGKAGGAGETGGKAGGAGETGGKAGGAGESGGKSGKGG